MKRIIVIGASSGMGYKVASDFARMGWKVGVAARRTEPLAALQSLYPDNVQYTYIDVTASDAVKRFCDLIERLGGMDVMLLCAGTGWNNPELDQAKDMHTLQVNVMGFTRMVNAAYKYFKDTANVSRGQIAAITSIAGTKGIGISATYSASKAYQSRYLQAIDQLAHQQHVNVAVTEIRPGFVNTDLLDVSRHNYPMLMSVDYVAPRIERAILRRRRVTTIDSRWAVVTALWRLIPNPIWRRIALDNPAK